MGCSKQLVKLAFTSGTCSKPVRPAFATEDAASTVRMLASGDMARFVQGLFERRKAYLADEQRMHIFIWHIYERAILPRGGRDGQVHGRANFEGVMLSDSSCERDGREQVPISMRTPK